MLEITIIGMGLIGTSLGMALRTADANQSPLGAITVTGYDTSRSAVDEARGRLAIDRPTYNLKDALGKAQVVVLAVPAGMLRTLFSEIAPLLQHGAVVTDVASTKSDVVEWACELLPRTIEFVGGHPMAGKEQSGARAADPDLFQGAVYCLTPGPNTRQNAMDVVHAMVDQVGAKPYFIDPAEHDSFVAGISHLPFILSAMLVETVSRSPSWREMAPLAATGFRDISRLASGSTEMHRDICLTNSAAITRWIDDMQTRLDTFRDLVQQHDSDALLEVFAHANTEREKWLESKPNMRPGEADFQNISGVHPERPSLFGRRGRNRK